MRRDPASAAVVVMLRSLEMYGMVQALDELIEQGEPAFDTAVPILSQPLKAELAEREVCSIAYQLEGARFTAYKDLTGFDFASSEIMKPQFSSCTAARSWKALTIWCRSVVLAPARPTLP